MPEKIAILADSGSDVPAELLNSYDNIEVAPMIVTMDGKEYRDNVDITPEEFYAALDHVDELPKTAAPTQGSVEAQVDKLRQRGFDHIIGITVSAHLSTSLARLPTLPERRPIFKWTWSTPRTLGLAADCLRCTQKK